MSEVLSSTSEINTNMTMVELKGNAVKQLDELNAEEVDFAISTIEKYIINEKHPTLLMLLSNELRYYTTLKIDKKCPRKAAEGIVDFLRADSYLKELGTLKLVEGEQGHLEIWIGSTFFALFNYDEFVVEV